MTNYCKTQNFFFRKGNDLFYIIKKLKSINLISEEEKNNYIKCFFYEVEEMDNIYNMYNKVNMLTLKKWESFIDEKIVEEAIDSKPKNLKELFPKIIPLFVKDKNSQNLLIEKVELYNGLHEIFIHKKPGITFEDLAKKFPQRREIMVFLGQIRTKNYLLDSDLCHQLAKYFINLRQSFFNKKEFECLKKLEPLTVTFFFINDKKEKVFVDDIMKNNDFSFKNEEFLSKENSLDFMEYIFKKERLKCYNNDEMMTINQTIICLGSLFSLNLDKNFVEEILEDFLKKMKIPRNKAFDETIKIQYSKKKWI